MPAPRMVDAGVGVADERAVEVGPRELCDVVGDAGRDGVVVERAHRREQLVEEVGLVGDRVRVRVVAAHADEEHLPLDARAARPSMSRATCRSCCAMPVLSSAPPTVNAFGCCRQRRGQDRVAVALAVSALSITLAEPTTTWFVGIRVLEQRHERVVARRRYRVRSLTGHRDTAVRRDHQRRGLLPSVYSCDPDTEMADRDRAGGDVGGRTILSAERPPQPVRTGAPGCRPFHWSCWSECENRFGGRGTVSPGTPPDWRSARRSVPALASTASLPVA